MLHGLLEEYGSNKVDNIERLKTISNNHNIINNCLDTQPAFIKLLHILLCNSSLDKKS